MSKVEVECAFCKKQFLKYPSAIKRTKNHLCSKECKISWLAEQKKETTKYLTKECSICKTKFKRKESYFRNKSSKNYYCSVHCKNEKLKKKRGGFTPIEKTCETCNKLFLITSRNSRRTKYCSEECKEKGFPKGKEHKNFKEELPRDYRSKHRLFHENTVWRKKVFERDLFTCQVCNKKGVKLQAHHLENYSSNKEKRFDIKNGVTLCIDCHKQFHKIYGVVRNNEEQFKEFKNSYTIK